MLQIGVPKKRKKRELCLFLASSEAAIDMNQKRLIFPITVHDFSFDVTWMFMVRGTFMFRVTKFRKSSTVVYLYAWYIPVFEVV